MMVKFKKSYSPLEKKILNSIPDDGRRVNTLDLVANVYEKEAPLTARQSVLDAANKLIRKVDHNKELFEIFRSEQHGPMPIYFWKEIRKAIKSDDFFSERHQTAS